MNADAIYDRAALVERLVEIATGAMPPAKADEFAAYLDHPGVDRRWINRVAPAQLPPITVDRPKRKSRRKPRSYVEKRGPRQLRLL